MPDPAHTPSAPPMPTHAATKPPRQVKPVPPPGVGTRNLARGRTHNHMLQGVDDRAGED